MPVPALNSSSNTPAVDAVVSSDNDDDDSGDDTEHPAVKQGRSSFIKYNSNNKLKPKRKIVHHVNKVSHECQSTNSKLIMINGHCLHFPNILPLRLCSFSNDVLVLIVKTMFSIHSSLLDILDM